MRKFFGYKIGRSADEEEQLALQSALQIVDKPSTDGSLELNSNAAGFFNYGISLDNALVDESALITKYRELSQQSEVEKAIDDIINEAFAYDDPDGPVAIDLTDVNLPEKTKDKIKDEFNKIIKMMNFKTDCYEIFRRWYVDGRIYYHKIINQDRIKDGIIEIRIIDPRKIKKIREQISNNKKIPQYAQMIPTSFEVNKRYIEYYIYNPEGVTNKNPNGIPIAPDSITYVHSGKLDKQNLTVLSHLHKAIKAFNSLRMMEDALVIYRIVRAPERRIFNIEVGNLPKQKAEQYVNELTRKYNKRLKFDPETGEISDDKRILTMMEDFWFPKRNGQGTTIDSLAGGQTLGEIDDIEYMKKKLYEALNVPVSRLQPDATFNLGRSSEITRDELKFNKFVKRLRVKFSAVFFDILENQLILKGILTSNEWKEIRDDIRIDFVEDTHFTELKNSEIWSGRINNLRDFEPYIGTMFSRQWVRTNILRLTEEEWDQMKEEMKAEENDPPLPSQLQNGFGMDGGGMDPMGGGMDPSMMGGAPMPPGGMGGPQDQMPPQAPPQNDEDYNDWLSNGQKS